MTAPRREDRNDRTHSPARFTPDSPTGAVLPPSISRAHPRNERAQPARRDNPDAPPARPRRSPERQPRMYTTPEFAPRRKRAPADEPPSPHDHTPEQLDRWDEEWRDEWDRGDIDDSAAYDEEVDIAEQTRDVEWLLDALDALDDSGGEDAFEWDE